MRVAFTTLAPFISGAERSLQITLRHLPAAGVTPLVIGPAGAAIVPWCEQNDVPFLPCPLSQRDKWRPLRWWRSIRRLRFLLRAHRVDVVHANQMWTYPAAGAAAGALGVPRVCHLRDEADPPTLRWCCASAPEAVVCISRHIARQAEAAWLAGGVGAGPAARPRIEVRLNPADLSDTADPADRDTLRADARRKFGVPTEAVTFGFIGQIRSVKGLLELLEALAGLSTARPWHLLVAGRDPTPGAAYEQLCRDRAGRPDLAGRVSFAGFLDDTAPFYRAIDVAVVPSLAEPLGRVPIEAAAFARPSIAFAVGGLPETIRDGRTGWLVPAGDFVEFRNAADRFAGRPDAAAGTAARAWVETVADPMEYAQYLASLYRQLLAPAVGPTDLLSEPCNACPAN
jgi:glycosyltransferase involved in cell wall biosynthesis